MKDVVYLFRRKVCEVMTDFDKALRDFEDLEERLALPEWEVKGVYVWKLLRVPVFAEYLQKLGLFENLHPAKLEKRKRGVDALKRLPKYLVSANPFFKGARNPKRFIIPSGRKRLVAGRVVDPITSNLWEDEASDDYLLLEKGGIDIGRREKNQYSLEVIQRIGWFLRKGKCIRFSSEDLYKINEIQRSLGVSDYMASAMKTRSVKKAIKNFLVQKALFEKLLNQRKPKYLYIVCAYGHEAFVAAAKDFGVETVELQHGAIGRGHMGYDFKNWDEVPYFPNKIFAFGPAWFYGAALPKSAGLCFVGHPSFEKEVECQTSGLERHSKTMLVLSQGSISDVLIREVVRFCELRKDWDVIYRPHPNEDSAHVRRFFELSYGGGNVWVDNKTSLVEQAAIANVAIGVYSSAIVEALHMGCRVAVLQLGNSPDSIGALIQSGDAAVFSSGQELADRIEEIPSGTARDFYVEPVQDILTLE